MGDLYRLIVRATVHEQVSAVWQIIDQFAPMIIARCRDTRTGVLDEDLLSEVRIQLFSRILRFRIDYGCGGDT
jgi:hypothetical protein